MEPDRRDVANSALCVSNRWPDTVELGPFVSWGRVYLAFRARLLPSLARCPLGCKAPSKSHSLERKEATEANAALIVKVHSDTTPSSKGKMEMAVEGWLYEHRLDDLAPAWHGLFASPLCSHHGRVAVAILEDAGHEVDVAPLSPGAKYVHGRVRSG